MLKTVLDTNLQQLHLSEFHVEREFFRKSYVLHRKHVLSCVIRACVCLDDKEEPNLFFVNTS